MKRIKQEKVTNEERKAPGKEWQGWTEEEHYWDQRKQ